MLHRQITEWEWYKDEKVSRVFIHLLLKANHKDGKWKGTTVKRGQLVTGRKVLAVELDISEQNVRTALVKLKSTNEITIKTTTQYSIITINKFDEYNLVTNDLTNNQPTTNQRLTTNNNVNNKDNVNKDTNTLQDDDKSSYDINGLIKLFKPLNPSYEMLFANKTQRKALERLVKKHTYLKVEKMLKSLPDTVTKPYAPKITTPLQFEQKLGELVVFISQERNKNVTSNKWAKMD